jgi:cytosine/adenosine deaminase-related metal-dependent hydrolase
VRDEATSGLPTEQVVDAAGRLVTPQPVDSHLHLDYANTVGQPLDNDSGTLVEGIQSWAEHKAAGLVDPDRVYADALAAVRSEVAHGVGHIRTHVDTTEPGLIALEAILQLRADVADWCDIEIIAFPQTSLYGFPDAVALLERALEEGADVVGGIPHLETTRELGVRHLETVFRLADTYGRHIDVHCDEIDDPGSRYLEVMTALSRGNAMEGAVTSSHSVAMAYYPDAYVGKRMQKLVDVRMNFAVNPIENLHLQGRSDSGPAPRGIAPGRRPRDPWWVKRCFAHSTPPHARDAVQTCSR